MSSNVIAFASYMRSRRRPRSRHAAMPGTAVIDLATWVRRTMPRRTPTGVFFISSPVRPHPA